MTEFAVIILFISALVLSTGFLVARASYLHRSSRYALMLGELYIPSFLLLLYGYFGLFVLLNEDGANHVVFRVPIQSIDLLIGYFCMLMASVAYLSGFVFVTNNQRFAKIEIAAQPETVRRTVLLFFVILIVLDLAARVHLIESGLYFTWMRQAFKKFEDVSLGQFFLLQNGFSPLLAALAIYHARDNRKWYAYLALLAGLILLEGSRTKIVLSMVTIVIVFVFVQRGNLDWKKISKRLLLAAVFVSLSLGVVFEVRKQFRADAKYAMQNPVPFLFESTTDAISRILIISPENEGGIELRGASFIERGTSWSEAFAAQIYGLRNFYPYLPLDSFFTELTTVVPSILYPGQKPKFSAGNNIGNAFGFAPPALATANHDPATTVFSSFFLYFGVIGMMGFSLAMGALIGLIYRFLVRRYNEAGSVIFMGLMYYYVWSSNSYAAALSGLRNAAVLLFLLLLLSAVFGGKGRYMGQSLAGTSRYPRE